MELYDSITGVGVIEALEGRFSAFTGSRFAVALNSATSALHAALIAAGVRRGDEVIVPAYTWGGSISGILQIGASPVFCDIDDALVLDPEEVRSSITTKTKAVIVVHLFGHPGDCDRLSALCRDHGIALIEDCAQAFGARLGGRSVGTFGTGCFSFSYGKALNVGEGGMLTTDDEDVYDRVLFYTQHPLRQRKDMLGVGMTNQFALNYRLSPFAAEAALRRFDGALAAHRSRTAAYNQLAIQLADADIKGFRAVRMFAGVEHAWHRYSPSIKAQITKTNRRIIEEFLASIGCRIEAGYVASPLYRDPALNIYLSARVRNRVQRTTLPLTEQACRERVGVRLFDDVAYSDVHADATR